MVVTLRETDGRKWHMDFIERLFGISPDGGDGSVEMLIFGLVVLVAVALAWRWRSRSMTPRT
jgi:MYXO-CTERM domain-containing protein